MIFEMKVIPEKKIFYIKVIGYYRYKEALEYLTAYKNHTNTFDTSKYSFIIDASEHSIVPNYMLPILKSILQMYSNDNYENIYIIPPNSEVVELQIKEITSKFNLHTIFINTLAEALRAI